MTPEVSGSSYILVKESIGLYHVLYEPIEGKAALFYLCHLVTYFNSVYISGLIQVCNLSFHTKLKATNSSNVLTFLDL
jgi:hypothetical protein